MNDYTPNSHRYKEEQKTASEERPKVEKVVSGKSKIKKKNEVRKLTDVFIKEDITSVGSYVIKDIIIPNIINTIVDAATDAIRMTFLGEKGRREKRSSADIVPYGSYYRGDSRRDSDRRDSRFNYDDIIFETRGDAEAVLDRMDDEIREYGQVSVGSLYDMADLTAPFTAEKYGWTNLRHAEVRRVRDGYIIELPRVKVLER